MTTPSTLDGGHARPQFTRERYWTRPNAPAQQWEDGDARGFWPTDADECHESPASRREPCCSVGVAAGVAACAYGLLGPSLLPLAAYLAGLALMFGAALVAVWRMARRDNAEW